MVLVLHQNFNYSCPVKYRSNESQKLLESFKKRKLEPLGSQSQNSNINIFKTDSVFTEIYKKSDKETKEPSKYVVPLHFGNTGMTWVYSS